MMIDLSPIIPTEDFWSRQTNVQLYSFNFAPFGISTEITANEPEVLAAARLSAGRFSQATKASSQPIHIQLVVRQETWRPVPDDLSERFVYSGVGAWITLSAGEWGYGFANLQTRTAVVFLSPALAAETRLVSRYFIDHYLLNFILTEWAMLHASCVLDARRQRLLIMVAPHNTGKSTTALRLLRAGYFFLADGMALFQSQAGCFKVGGYPVGEVKLRDDILALLPDYRGEAVNGREQRKTVVNLRAIHPDRLVEQVVVPSSVQLCFIERDVADRPTQVKPLTVAEALPRLAANTVYWHEAQQLAHNTAALHALLEQAELYQVRVNGRLDDIVTTLDQLA